MCQHPRVRNKNGLIPQVCQLEVSYKKGGDVQSTKSNGTSPSRSLSECPLTLWAAKSPHLFFGAGRETTSQLRPFRNTHLKSNVASQMCKMHAKSVAKAENTNNPAGRAEA